MNIKKIFSGILNAGILMVAGIFSLSPETVAAENTGDSSSRPIFSRYTFELGRAHLLSTYLSPIAYHGPEYTLTGEWRKKMPFNPDWEMEFQGQINLADAQNEVKNSTMLKLDLSFSWGMEYVWKLPEDWRLGVGGAVEAEGGVLYLRRNSNNPANALARAGLNLTASAFHPIKLGCLNVTVFDQLSLPSIGLFFSPEYGETYYEIYLGNRKGLVNCGWWGNNFCFDNLLGAELHFGCRSLILGWRYALNTIHAHSLDTQLWRHSGVIGIKF